MKSPKLSIIIVNYNTSAQTCECIQSILKNGIPSQEIIVVDNDSKDDSVEQIQKQFPDVLIIATGENLGFAKGCNVGAKRARGEYLGFINSDCIAGKDSIELLVHYLDEHSDTMVAIPRLLENDGSIQNNVSRLPTTTAFVKEYLLGRVASWYKLAYIKAPYQVEAFSGAAVVIRAESYWEVGGFDERYFMYVEDVELSFNLAAHAYKVMYIPHSLLTHNSGGSSHSNQKKLNEMLHQNRIDYAKRHFSIAGAITTELVIRLGVVIMKIKIWIKKYLFRR